MKSSVTNIINILKEDVEFISNGFNQGYSFDEQSAAKYFEELITNNENNPIFSGIIILQKQANNYSIVDGLQRLTTINLLLAALCDSCKNDADKLQQISENVRYNYLVLNNKPKLTLDNDNATFKKIILEQSTNGNDESTQLFAVYKKFLDLICENNIKFDKLFKLISQIQYMVVITKESEIATRDLYQSLNKISEESQINLITDFVNQQGPPARKTWNSIVNLFNSTPNKLESFLKDFLQTRLDDEITNKEALYNNFKKYFYKLSQFQKNREIIENIHKYALYYLKIVNERFESDEIKHQINILNKNSGRDTYPYLMEVLDDLENGHITQSAFLNILMMINLFIKSREEYTIGNTVIDFSKLSKELNKMLVLENYVPKFISENKLTINEITNLSNFEVQ